MSKTKKTEEKYHASSSTFFSSKKLDKNNIKMYVIHCLSKNQHEKLKSELSKNYGLKAKEIDNFLLQEKVGDLLLIWALTTDKTEKSFIFFTEIASSGALQTVLQRKNFSVFKSFLNVQVALQEKEGHYTTEIEEAVIKKFVILLNICPAIKDFMRKQENMDNPYLQTPKIKEDFNTALQHVESNRSAPTLIS